MRNPFSSSSSSSHPQLSTPLPTQPFPPSYPEHIHSPTFHAHSQYPTQVSPEHVDRPSPSSFPSTSGPLKPWLGLRARLGLSWISPTILALVFVGGRLTISAGDVDDKVAAAKEKLLASCKGVEAAASSISSLPHYMADRMNERTAHAINDTVAGAQKVLYLAVVAIEQILKFIVDSYRSLFLCFIELLVRGTLSILMSTVHLLSEGIQTAGNGIKSAIEASVDGVNGFLSTVLGGVNDTLSLIGQSITIPTVAQPDLSALDNITLPSSFSQGLLNLNSSLPTLDDLRNKMDDLILIPFENLKGEIDSTLGTYSFNRSLLPVPQAKIVQLCSSIDTSPLDDLGQELQRLCYTGVGILAAAALGLMLLNFGKEWWSWRSLKRHVEATREAWLSIDQPFSHQSQPEPTFIHSTPEGHQEREIPKMVSPDFLQLPNLFSLLQLSTHPLLAMLAFRLARILGIRSPQAKSQLRWWLAFISHPAAVAALAIGLVGLLSVQAQLWALKPIQDHYSKKLDGSFNSIGDDFLSKLNSQTQEMSYDYSNRSNVLIINAQNDLNNHVFGWVNTTTSTMNDTLNEFMDGLATVLNETFANTPLFTPLQSFIDCIIGQKVVGIEKALAWIQDNAEVNFPTVSPDVLMLDSARIQELVAPVQDAALGDGTPENEGLVPRLVNSYAESLKRERIMFLIFIGVYLLIFLVGTAVAIWYGVGKAKWEERKETKLKDENAGHVSPYPVEDDGSCTEEKTWDLNNLGYGVSRQAEKEFGYDVNQSRSHPSISSPQGLFQNQPQSWPNSHNSNSFLSITSSNNEEESLALQHSLNFNLSPPGPNQRFAALPRTNTSTPEPFLFRSRSVTPNQDRQESGSSIWSRGKEAFLNGIYWWYHGSQLQTKDVQVQGSEKLRPAPSSQRFSRASMTSAEADIAFSRDVPTHFHSNSQEPSDLDRDLHAQIFQSGPDVRYPHSETTDPNFEPFPRDLRSSRFNSTSVTSPRNLPPRPLPTPPSTNLQHETILNLGNPDIKKPIPQFAMDRNSILGSRNRRSSTSSGDSSNPFNRLSHGSRKPLRSSHSFSRLRRKNRDPSLRFRTLSAVAEVRESVSPQISPREAVMERGEMEVQLTRNPDFARDHILTGLAF